MIYIYHCFGGSHSSVTAAAIHLGLLPSERLPTADELMAVPYYDKTPGHGFGNFRLIGVSQKGDPVYALGKKNLGGRMNQLFACVAEMTSVQDQYVAVNTMPEVNILMMMGGFLSRRLGIVYLGRPILIWGTRLAFPRLQALVAATKGPTC